MKFKKYILILTALAIMPFMLTACGEAVFGKEDPLEDPDPSEIISAGLSTIDDADEIIDNSGSYTEDELTAALEDKHRAQAALASAYLEDNGISTIEIILDVGALAARESEEGEGESDEDTLFSIVDFDDSITKEGLDDSLDMYNAVDSSYLPEEEQDSFELRKGIANTVMVVELVTGVYDVEDNSFISSESTNKELLNDMVAPTGFDSLADYADNAEDGFDESGAFSDDDLEIISDVVELVGFLEELNTLAQSNASGTVDGQSYNFSTGDDEALILQALENLLGGGD